MCENTVGKKATIINKKIPNGDVPITYADITKANKELNYNPISLAVAWVIYNQDILSPIISARNLKQLIPSLDSMKISITKEIYESINKITRTPPPATDRLEDVEG